MSPASDNSVKVCTLVHDVRLLQQSIPPTWRWSFPTTEWQWQRSSRNKARISLDT